ncbi:LamG domain-containing protein, partial [bacterium]|nr:LamG domain-containing protein [bacterium]
MVFSILPANTESAAYEISNSLRSEADDSPKLSKTVSTATNTTNMTFSLWYKLGELATMGFISKFADSNNRFHLRIMDDGSLLAYNNVSGTHHYKTTTAKLRDFSAWYHIVFAYDTTDSTAEDRLKIYLNGTRLTSFVNNTNPSSNEALKIASDTSNPIKLLCSNDEDAYLSGYVSDLYYIDGQTKAPTDFGETNDNGVWIPKKYLGTFGNNGFKMEFQQTGTSANSSGIGADTSGNDHHLTVANLAATDVTTDTPTNNFATMNPVHVSSYGSAALPTFSEGNLKIGMNSDSSTSSTIAPSKGKWYVEYKQGENTADNGGYPIVGISATLGGTAGDVIGFRTPDSTNYRGQLGTTSVNNAFGSARSANDIFGFYINLDDDILIVHKNGSDYMGSGASSGLNWSGGLTTTNLQTGFYHFYVQNNQDGSPAYTDEVN